MEMAGTNNDCKPCKRMPKNTATKKAFSWIPGILLVILPKCPFCFMAFSSTMLLCGEGVSMVSERVHHSDLTILLSGLFCAIALVGIILVRRDIRTFYAFMLAATGAVMVMTSVAWSGGLPLYYAGTSLIFLGVWLNSSLLYVLKKIGWVRIPEMSRAFSK